ncbi:hypothetical protein H4217_008982, partial [Coemansia sp. RSA 1939]
MAQVATGLAHSQPERSSVARRNARRVAFFDVRPIRRPDNAPAKSSIGSTAGSTASSNARNNVTRTTDTIGTALATSVVATGGSGAAAETDNGSGKRGACLRTISLPSDVIDAIGNAAAGIAISSAAATVSGGQGATAAVRMSHRRLGVALELSDEAQAVLRTMSQVCRAWRRALLVRAWRSVCLSGEAHPCVDDIHAFASVCAKRLVVPWGAMAAPVSWGERICVPASLLTDAELDSDDASADWSTEYSVAFGADSSSRIHSTHDKASGSSLDSLTSPSSSATRLRCVFGDRAWPAAEHLDMSFMPLICYQGFSAHIRRTMPRLRSLRISGFVPATALAEILDSARLPLAALEIAGSVWANGDSGRRGSTSSWHSSATTVAPGMLTDDAADDAADDMADDSANAAVASRIAGCAATDASDAQHGLSVPRTHHCLSPGAATMQPPLGLLALTADALRSATVFAFAMAQAPTLSALHLLECDHKIMDMLRTGRLEERHMRAVEWGTTQMVLHSQENTLAQTASRLQSPSPVRWLLLRELHIVQFHMSPRENTGLRIHADCMPMLDSVVVGSMEPSDHHHPAPTPDDAMQVPQLCGVFSRLTRISAPVLDLDTLPAKAPALQSVHISCGSGPLSPAAVSIDALLSSKLPLKRLVV